MMPIDAYPLWERKLLYRLLHAALREHDELLDAEVLGDLQAGLRASAAGEGVDTSDHGAWDRWLGKAAAARLTVLRGGQS